MTLIILIYTDFYQRKPCVNQRHLHFIKNKIVRFFVNLLLLNCTPKSDFS